MRSGTSKWRVHGRLPGWPPRTPRDNSSGPQPIRRSQRGASASTQYAILIPALMLIIFGMIQTGIYLHARNVVDAAANAAADVARSYHGNPQRARQVAHKVAAVGGLRDVRISVVRHQRTVSVTVTGRAPVLLDLGLAVVHASADAPIERVTEP